MTAMTEAGIPSHAEFQQPLLAAEVAHVRALLEAYRREDDPPVGPHPTAGDETPEPALDHLVRVLGLSTFERQVLLLAAATELDGTVASLIAAIHGGGDARPTFALALAALPDPHWDALAPRSPLRRWRLVELGPGDTLVTRALRLDERVLHHLTGVPAVDARLEGLLTEPGASELLSATQQALADDLARTLDQLGTPAVVGVGGDDVSARLGVARRMAGSLGLRALVVRASALPASASELAGLATLVDREALLLHGLPVVDVQDAPAPVVSGLVELLGSPVVVVIGRHDMVTTDRVALHRSVELPAAAEQRSLWVAALGRDHAAALAPTIDEIAQHHRLGAAAVGAIGRELVASGVDGGQAGPALRRLCLERSRARLDALAQRLRPAATWDDLVVPEALTEVLREIARQVRHRATVYEDWGFAERSSGGLGVTALFAGESGTGKTMAAEVLAADLELDLYRVDLSATVSKYIGETEKNLRRLFDAAESAGAVLLFDEADALFGRRSEVRDSHDRYANLEVAYLLQRMEAYRGLAILTTNLHSNLDTAFLRRLRFAVQFPFPDAAHRAAIWRRAFPARTPVDGLDPDRLAQLMVSGGSIRSIALSAAFAAAEDGTAVTPAHVLRAARFEYAKAERSLTRAETAGLL